MTFYELVTLLFVAFSTLATIGSFIIMLHDSLKQTRKKRKKKRKKIMPPLSEPQERRLS